MFIVLITTCMLNQLWHFKTEALSGLHALCRRVFHNDKLFDRLDFFIKLMVWGLIHPGTNTRPQLQRRMHYRFSVPKYEKILERNIATVLKDLQFPMSLDPRVSIIIPIYNRVVMALECLCSLQRNLEPEIPIEIIIADDCSPDPSTSLLSKIHGTMYIRNHRNLGYIRNCNNAAKVAHAPFLAFLNSDVIVFKNWLSELMLELENEQRIGVVGPMLIGEDGSIQECGVNIDKGLNHKIIGRGEYPVDPKFCSPFEVGYCSGACLLTRRNIFLKVHGLSEYLDDAFFDDMDYALKLRKNGFSSFVVPSAKVLHHEHSSYSSGRRSNSFSRNQRIMKEKWV